MTANKLPSREQMLALADFLENCMFSKCYIENQWKVQDQAAQLIRELATRPDKKDKAQFVQREDVEQRKGWPVPWLRGHVSHTDVCKEYDEEVCAGSDCPEGKGWIALYTAAPSADAEDARRLSITEQDIRALQTENEKLRADLKYLRRDLPNDLRIVVDLATDINRPSALRTAVDKILKDIASTQIESHEH